MSLQTRLTAAFQRIAQEFNSLRGSLSAVATTGSYADLSDKPVAGDGGFTEKNFTTALNSKLVGIESNAKDDQTGAEIETLLDATLGSTDWKSGGSFSGVGVSMVWAEENSNLNPATSSGFQFSFGNGATGIDGLAIGYACKIIATTIRCTDATTGSVELYVNGTATGHVVSVSAAEGGILTGISHDINPGDYINFKTLTGSGGTKVVVGAALQVTEPASDPNIFNNGNVSGTVSLNYNSGNYQQMTLTANVTSLSVANWSASGKFSSLTLVIDMASALTCDFSFVTSWSNEVEPTLAVGENIIIFTTKDGGTKVVGHAISLGG